MKKIYLTVISCIWALLAYGQNYLFYSYAKPADNITKVHSDTAYIKVLMAFLVDENGEKQEIKIEGIQCSYCIDSLIDDSRTKAIDYIKNLPLGRSTREGKSVKVKFRQGVTFTFDK